MVTRTPGSGTKYDTKVRSSSGGSSGGSSGSGSNEVKRTEGSGTKYDTSVKDDPKASGSGPMPTPNKDSKSGSEKLADHREATKNVTPGESPEEYRNRVVAERKSTNDVSPFAQAGARRTISESERQAIIDRHDTSPLRPDRIQDRLYQKSQEEKETVKPFGGAPEYAYEKVWSPIHNYLESTRKSAEKEGYQQAENITISPTWLTVAEKGKAIGDDIRDFGNSGANLIPLEYGLGDKPYIFPKVTNIAGGIVESASMFPGGVDVIRKNPGIIPAAATAGVIGTAKGTGEQLAKDPAQFVVDNAVTYALFAGLGKGAQSVKLKPGRVVEITKPGADPVLTPIEYGKTLTVLDKPVVSYSQGRLYSGAAPVPVELVQGKTITAFNKLETAAFEKTLKKHNPSEAEYYNVGQDITGKMYKTNEPVFKPEHFDILSDNIPDTAKPAVMDTIRNYPGELNVYGSVTQKQQLGGYMTRTPKDIELIVDNSQKFLSDLEPRLQQQGIKYTVEGGDTPSPKVYFETPGGKTKGIELFQKDTSTVSTTKGYTPESDIAYGYTKQKPVVVDGLDTLRLSEQAARKYEGATVLKDMEIQPKHQGRVKDVRDLIEIGTGYAVEKKLPIEQDLLRYAELSAKRYPDIVESPVVNFLVEQKKLPTKADIGKLIDTGISPEPIFERTLLASKSKKPTTSELVSSFIDSSLKDVSSSPIIIPKVSIPSSIIGASVPEKSSYASPIPSDISIKSSYIFSDIAPPDSSSFIPPKPPEKSPPPMPPASAYDIGSIFSDDFISDPISKNKGKSRKFDFEDNNKRSRKNPFEPNIGIKRGRRKNLFGDVHKILFGR